MNTTRRYPRTARINEILREVLAETLERLADSDDRLSMLTITGVEADPDLRHARVWLASMSEGDRALLDGMRVRLQAAIGRQVHLKRTPLLSFAADPAVSTGERVEEILRRLQVSGADEPAFSEDLPVEGTGKSSENERTDR
jgi:ribosome-binding factor A